MSQPCALYRHFNAAGRLLYVGISLNALIRLSQHRDTAPWFQEISRVDVEWHPSREVAHAAERKAIRFELPVYNRQRYLDEVSTALSDAEDPGVTVHALDPILFAPVLRPDRRAALFARLAQSPTDGEIRFKDSCRVLGLDRATMLRLGPWFTGETCPLTANELHEVAHRLAVGTAVMDGTSSEVTNFSTTPEWTVRLYGRQSPLVPRAIAVDEGRFADAALMWPIPAIPAAQVPA